MKYLGKIEEFVNKMGDIKLSPDFIYLIYNKDIISIGRIPSSKWQFLCIGNRYEIEHYIGSDIKININHYEDLKLLHDDEIFILDDDEINSHVLMEII